MELHIRASVYPMDKNYGTTWIKKLKAHPSVLVIVLLAVIFGSIGLAVRAWSRDARPDLKWRLTKTGFQPEETLITASLTSFTCLDEHMRQSPRWMIAKLVENRYFTDPENHDNDYHRLTVKYWIFDLFTLLTTRDISFTFEGHPDNSGFKLSGPQRFETYGYAIPITAYALYSGTGEVLIQARLLDPDGEIASTSNTRVHLNETSLGANINVNVTTGFNIVDPASGENSSDTEFSPVTGAVNTGRFPTELGYHEHMAIGISTNEYTCGSLQNDGPENQPLMRSHLGVIIVPVYQPEYAPPLRTINLPGSGYSIYAKPYGKPCLFIETGASNNHWYTEPPNDGSVPDENLWLCENDDRWKSYYLYDCIHDRVLSRKRFGEENPDGSPYFQSIIGYSNHADANSSGEFVVLGWPKTPDFYVDQFYSFNTNSDNDSETWWFEPEDSYNIIPYGRQFSHYKFTHPRSFVDSEERIGFVIINQDGSAGIIRQNSAFSPVELLAFVESDPNYGNITSFNGLVSGDEGKTAFVFSTDQSMLLVTNEEGALLQTTDIAGHFNRRQTYFNCVNTSNGNHHVSGKPDLIVLLSDNEPDIMCTLECNEKYIPNWPLLSSGVYVGLAVLFVLSGLISDRFIRNRGWFSYGELTSQLGTEREVRRKIPDFTHSRQKSIYSAVFHEMGRFASTIRAFTQRDYRILNEIRELLDQADPDMDEIRERLESLKGIEKYNTIITDAIDYLKTMEAADGPSMPLVEIIERSIRLHRNVFIRNMVEVSFERNDIDFPVPPATGLVFDNLLNNAVDAVSGYRGNSSEHNNYQGRIYVGLETENGSVKLVVEDNGLTLTGKDGTELPEEEWDRIFYPGYSTKASERGHSGLGLSISREFAEREGWRLYVEKSNDENFTKRFVLLFPQRDGSS